MAQPTLTPDELRERFEALGIDHQVPDEPTRLLLRPQVEELLGLAPEALRKYRMPPPDALVGSRPQLAWTEATIRAWNSTRPSQLGNVDKRV